MGVEEEEEEEEEAEVEVEVEVEEFPRDGQVYRVLATLDRWTCRSSLQFLLVLPQSLQLY